MQISCRDFSGGYTWVNARDTLDVTMASLIHATETLTAPPLREAGLTGWHALHFAYHKVYAIASVMVVNNNSITLPEGYSVLDQSEKNVLSYYTGMTLAQLVADQILGITEPIHARSMKECGFLETDAASRSIPDIVGQDQEGNWHVIEAKCRYQRPGTNAIHEWKMNQARAVMTINGEAPRGTTSCCITSQKTRFIVDFVDPVPDEETPVSKKEKVIMTIDPREIQRSYYKPFAELFRNDDLNESYEKKEILFKSLASDPLHKETCCIGIRKSILDQVLLGEPVKGIKHESKKGLYLGSDGIAVKLLPYMRLHDCKKSNRHLRKRA
jgi:hypothetical protein